MLKEKLEKYGQEHVLTFYDQLDDEGKKRLKKQLSDIDFDFLQKRIADSVLQKPEPPHYSQILPAPYYTVNPRDENERTLYEQAFALGETLLKTGKVSFLTVAGGQGSRLGFDGPKGSFPISVTQHKSLFQYFAETIARIGEKYDTSLTWYIMTSALNDRQTRDFFATHNHFGLPPDRIVFFAQGTMPVMGYDGRILLAGKDSLALAPDGHGGTLLALKRNGCLDRMKRDGVDFVSYFQVDNPLVPMADPLFIGLHALQESEISARALIKTGPFEKLGNFCMVDGRLTIIEYSDMPDELAQQRNADGTLTFAAGSPAIHVISRSFIEQLTEGGSLQLPWHRADKKVAYMDLQSGEVCQPQQNNAVKLESFIFDAVPLAKKTLILEAVREESFAPTKNATGVDSVESCRAMLAARDARRLHDAGVTVPPDAVIEISPRECIDDSDVCAYIKRANFTPPHPGENYYQ